jgi:hypothetical protein
VPNRDVSDYLAHRIRTICEQVDSRAVAFDGDVGQFHEAANGAEVDLLAKYAYRLAVLTQKRTEAPARRATAKGRRGWKSAYIESVLPRAATAKGRRKGKR